MGGMTESIRTSLMLIIFNDLTIFVASQQNC